MNVIPIPSPGLERLRVGGWPHNHSQWSFPCSGHMRQKPFGDPLLASLVRVEASTAPLSCNKGHELAKRGTPMPSPYPKSSTNPASSTFPEFWPSPVFWTALMPCPDPDLVIAHVRIWLIVPYSSCALGTSGSAPA